MLFVIVYSVLKLRFEKHNLKQFLKLLCRIYELLAEKTTIIYYFK